MKGNKVLTLLVMAVFLAISVVACGENSSQENNNITSINSPDDQNDDLKQGESSFTGIELLRRDGGGDVTVDIMFLNPIENFTDKLAFKVNMNTHSVDLAAIDVSEHAVLVNSNGKELEGSFIWDIIDSTSHHPWGYLEIEMPERDFLEDIAYIELRLIDMAEIPEMSFIWEKEFIKP